MPTDDRERQFERALARHFRNASPDLACPDAETLAAYHERTLSLEEMAQWKSHIAECARCQESLALVEQSEQVRAEEWEKVKVPVPAEGLADAAGLPTVTRSLRREQPVLPAAPAPAASPTARAALRTRWRWMAAAGALAAGVMVWVGTRELGKPQKHAAETVEIAQNRTATPQVPQARDQALAQSNKQEALAGKLPPPEPSTKTSAALRAKMAPSDKERPDQPAAFSTAAPSRVRESDRKDSGAAVGGIVSAPAPQPPALLDETKNAAEVAPPALAPSAAPAAPSPSRQAAAKAPVAAAQAESTQVTTEARGLFKARNLADTVQVAAVKPGYILAPRGKIVWRVGEAGKIEQTTDGGKAWKLQNSGVTADLTAGSAPSDKICWVVGKAGTVLLTTDGGEHWKQLTSPVTADWGGVQATDALHASVWDIPNRQTFATSDGGATWQPTTNP